MKCKFLTIGLIIFFNTSVTAQNTLTKFAKNSIGTTYKEVNKPDLFLVL